jgi:hypothetical protein
VWPMICKRGHAAKLACRSASALERGVSPQQDKKDLDVGLELAHTANDAELYHKLQAVLARSAHSERLITRLKTEGGGLAPWQWQKVREALAGHFALPSETRRRSASTCLTRLADRSRRTVFGLLEDSQRPCPDVLWPCWMNRTRRLAYLCGLTFELTCGRQTA